MSVTFQEFSTEAELRAHYKAVRARMNNLKPPVRRVEIAAQEPEPAEFPISPVEVKAEVIAPPVDEPQPVPTNVLLKRILTEVAAEFMLTVNDLRCAGRQERLCIARRMYCYRAATETLASFPQIGGFLGGRDHTTVMHSIAKYCLAHNVLIPRGAKWTRSYRIVRFGTLWPDNRVKELRRLRDLGLNNIAIGEMLGCTEGAVCGAVNRFGLPLRNSKHHPVDTFKVA